MTASCTCYFDGTSDIPCTVHGLMTRVCPKCEGDCGLDDGDPTTPNARIICPRCEGEGRIVLCGECDSPLMVVGPLNAFCTTPGCSMYDRDVRPESAT